MPTTTTLKIETSGYYGISLEKPFGDPQGAILFMEGFAEAARMFTNGEDEYTVTMKVVKKA